MFRLKDNFTQKLVRSIKHFTLAHSGAEIMARHLTSLSQPHFDMIFSKSNIKETM